jgi:hypothetical protein
VAVERREPEYEPRAASRGESRGRSFGIEHSRVVRRRPHRSVLVEPSVAAVLVDRRERFLDETRHARVKGGVDQRGRSLAANAVVLPPRTWEKHLQARRRNVGREVHDRVVSSHRRAKLLDVEQVDPDGMRSLVFDRSPLRRRPRDPRDGVPRRDERPNDAPPDHTGSAGDEYPHA